MKRTQHKNGFTIVELLTVMAVIALLIGLLVPALSMVKDRAKDIQQRTQFHAINSGLEMFKADFGDYPDSADNALPPLPVAPLAVDPNNYGGAQKLAEALVGYDLLGIHPKTGFRSDGQNYFPANPGYAGGYAFVYDTTNGLNVGNIYTEINGKANINARKGTYVELENANAFQMQDVYGTNFGTFNRQNMVMCDVYSKARPSGKKTGTPILYFKADVTRSMQDINDALAMADDIYKLNDNFEMIDLGTAEATPKQHKVFDTTTFTAYENFENLIINQQVLQSTITAANPQGIRRPYRANSYILWSAGKDGNFGTADDVFNFTKEAE